MDSVRSEEMERRVERLESNLRRHRALTAACLAGCAAVLALSSATQTPPPADGGVLRVRGLVVVDAKGRERILLGAPVPEAAGRKRKDATTSLVFVDENGADRVALGWQPDPQIGGKVVPRASPAVGLNVYDGAGNERGGFSYLESGAVVLGLDTNDGREGISLAVDDKAGYSGVMMASRKGGTERLGLFVDDDVAVVKLADATGSERLILMAGSEAQKPKLLVLGPHHESETDALEMLPK